MDKEIITSNHSVSINERKSISITGVKKIDSFDNEEFLMDTVMGYVKLDTFQGNVSIKGKINSLSYIEGSGKKNKDSGVFSKLFKQMDIIVQLKTILFSIVFGVLFSISLRFNYKYIIGSRRLLSFILTFLFVIVFTLLYFIGLRFINFVRLPQTLHLGYSINPL